MQVRCGGANVDLQNGHAYECLQTELNPKVPSLNKYGYEHEGNKLRGYHNIRPSNDCTTGIDVRTLHDIDHLASGRNATAWVKLSLREHMRDHA